MCHAIPSDTGKAVCVRARPRVFHSKGPIFPPFLYEEAKPASAAKPNVEPTSGVIIIVAKVYAKRGGEGMFQTDARDLPFQQLTAVLQRSTPL